MAKSALLPAILVLSLGTVLVACDSPTPTPVPTQPPAAEVEAGTETDCLQEKDNELAQSIAGQFDVSYDQVMAWACAGETFDDILLALQTSQLSGRSVQELLEMRKDGGWEQVWETLDLLPVEAPPAPTEAP